MKRPLIYLLPLAFLITSCTHWIGAQSRALADRGITFSQLREDPDAFRGKLVLLGGVVVAATQTAEGTSLEVVEHRLDSRELPDQVMPSRGRFLATTPDRLDPAEYKKGALVSMMGEVAGKKVEQQDGTEYTYPVIAVREIHAIEFHEFAPEYDFIMHAR
jgi:outer membrane lipoprotein